MNFKHIMVREHKKDKHILALILDSYNPQSDTLQYIDITTRQYTSGRYLQIRDHSVSHPVTFGSQEEMIITEMLSKEYVEPIFTTKFSNPNRKLHYPQKPDTPCTLLSTNKS